MGLKINPTRTFVCAFFLQFIKAPCVGAQRAKSDIPARCRYTVYMHLYCIISRTCCKPVWCIFCTQNSGKAPQKKGMNSMSIQTRNYTSKKTGKTKTSYYADVWFAAENRSIKGKSVKNGQRQSKTRRRFCDRLRPAVLQSPGNGSQILSGKPMNYGMSPHGRRSMLTAHGMFTNSFIPTILRRFSGIRPLEK